MKFHRFYHPLAEIPNQVFMDDVKEIMKSQGDIIVHCSDGVCLLSGSLLSASSKYMKNIISETQFKSTGNYIVLDTSIQISLPDATQLEICLLNALLLFGEVEGSKENAKSIKMILKLLQIDIFNSDDLIVTTRSLNMSLNTCQVYQDNIQIKEEINLDETNDEVGWPGPGSSSGSSPGPESNFIITPRHLHLDSGLSSYSDSATSSILPSAESSRAELLRENSTLPSKGSDNRLCKASAEYSRHYSSEKIFKPLQSKIKKISEKNDKPLFKKKRGRPFKKKPKSEELVKKKLLTNISKCVVQLERVGVETNESLIIPKSPPKKEVWKIGPPTLNPNNSDNSDLDDPVDTTWSQEDDQIVKTRFHNFYSLTDTQCTVCRHQVETNKVLEEHFENHSNPEKFYCSTCQKFLSLLLLDFHVSRNHKVVEPISGYVSHSSSGRTEEEKVVGDWRKSFNCDECRVGYKKFGDFMLHMKKHKSRMSTWNSRIFTCIHCSQHFGCPENKKIHELTNCEKNITPEEEEKMKKNDEYKYNLTNFFMKWARKRSWSSSGSGATHDNKKLKTELNIGVKKLSSLQTSPIQICKVYSTSSRINPDSEPDSEPEPDDWAKKQLIGISKEVTISRIPSKNTSPDEKPWLVSPTSSKTSVSESSKIKYNLPDNHKLMLPVVKLEKLTQKQIDQIQGAVKQRYICGLCDKRFTYKKSYVVHCRKCTSQTDYRFSCDLCGATFKSSECIKDHSKTHPKQSMFKCEECEIRRETIDDIRSHLLEHSTGAKHQAKSIEQKPIQPLADTKSIKPETNLKSHSPINGKTEIRSSRIIWSNGVVIYPKKRRWCDQCQKLFSFTSTNKLRHHQEFACEALPFKCKTCKIRKKTVLDLEEHVCTPSHTRTHIMEEKKVSNKTKKKKAAKQNGTTSVKSSSDQQGSEQGVAESGLEGSENKEIPGKGKEPLLVAIKPPVDEITSFIVDETLDENDESLSEDHLPSANDKVASSFSSNENVLEANDDLKMDADLNHTASSTAKRNGNTKLNHVFKGVRKNQVRKFHCHACRLKFTHKSNYLYHLSTHYMKSYCSICTKRFSYNTLLVSHLSTHS